MSTEQHFDTEDEPPARSGYSGGMTETTTCILTEADILAGRDEDCTMHEHEDWAADEADLLP